MDGSSPRTPPFRAQGLRGAPSFHGGIRQARAEGGTGGWTSWRHSLRYTGVLFDLFGTLVPPFRMREHQEVMSACAAHLGIDADTCYRGWAETFRARICGGFPSIAANLEAVGQGAGRQPGPESILRAERQYHDFTREGLTPVEGALDTLAWLKSRGLRLGLVTNCAPDVPLLWPETAFQGYFEYCAFSCDVGMAKPEPGIYHCAIRALELKATETLFVGDGSDRELSGAIECGLHAVLLKADLSNTYDARRHDVASWHGPAINTIAGIRDILTNEVPVQFRGATEQ